MKLLKFNLQIFSPLFRIIVLAALVPSCTSEDINETLKNLQVKLPIMTDRERGVMISQILVFREDYPGKLTHRDSKDILSYDLSSEEVRRTLDTLYFSCSLGLKSYFICQDKIGLCRNTDICLEWKKKIFAKDVCLKFKQEYIDAVADIVLLANSNVRCVSELYY